MLHVRPIKCSQEYEVSKSHNKNMRRYIRQYNTVLNDEAVRFRIDLFQKFIVLSTYGPCFASLQSTCYHRQMPIYTII